MGSFTYYNNPEVVIDVKKDNENINSYNLIYPEDLSNSNHYIEFKYYEPGSFTTEKAVRKLYDSVSSGQSGDIFENIDFQEFGTYTPPQYKNSIFLYIPGELTTSYEQQYSESELTSERGQMIENFIKGGSGALADQGVQKLIEAISGTTGLSGRIENKMNKITNPRIELHYNRPSLRTHSFSFNFLPKTESETISVNEIIKAFKVNSTPELQLGGAIYKKPMEWRISFSGNNKYLFNIAESYLTNISVDYAGQKLPSFFEKNKAPTSIILSLTFKESIAIFRDDILEKNY